MSYMISYIIIGRLIMQWFIIYQLCYLIHIFIYDHTTSCYAMKYMIHNWLIASYRDWYMLMLLLIQLHHIRFIYDSQPITYIIYQSIYDHTTFPIWLYVICDSCMYTPEKQLCLLQFSAHEACYVVVNVWQINMTKIIIMKHLNLIKYMIFLMV